MLGTGARRVFADGLSLQLQRMNEEFEADGKSEIYASMGGLAGVAAAVGTDVTCGLDAEDAASPERSAAFGRNEVPVRSPEGFLSLFWDALSGDLTLRVLLASAAISIIVGVIEDRRFGWIEGFAIFLAVFIVALVTATNEYLQERQFQALNKVKESYFVNSLRGGVRQQCLVADVAVGDVIVLERDDSVPGDGVLVSGDNLTVSLAQVNGESAPHHITEELPFIISGARIDEGFGRMLITAVGPNSRWGETLRLLAEKKEDPKTPLQKKLHELANRIGKFGAVFGVLIFVVLVISYFASLSRRRGGIKWGKSDTWSHLIEFFIVAVTIVVVAVPEGLPLAVTVSLAYSMKRMYKDNNLVRKLVACETMGSATQICSDKTGTLTQNKMHVVDGWFAGRTLTPKAEGGSELVGLSPDVVALLAEALVLNSSATIETSISPVDGSEVYKIVGMATEGALVLFARDRLNCDYTAARASGNYRKRYSFNPEKKRQSTILTIDASSPLLASPDSLFRVHCKGASEEVLALCSHAVDPSGQRSLMDQTLRQSLNGIITKLASDGLRTLCIASIDLEADGGASWDESEPTYSMMTVLAIVGIADPLRPEVPAAVSDCLAAGIGVRMLTGDNLLTAKKIARDCGILTPDGVAIEGGALRAMGVEELRSLLPRLQVVARCKPADKDRLVKELRRMGEVVAVTGDGSNDAPALKNADVGLAMGITGTRLAIEASAIVILDDNFASIVKAVMWGRAVFDNIRKFLMFQVTINIVALTISLVGPLAQRGSPLKAVQLLWVNLIMDTMAALALGTERPTRELLRRRPLGRDAPLISHLMWRNIICHSIWQITILLLILFLGPRILNLDVDIGRDAIRLDTIIFNVFVLFQLFNEINARRVNADHNVFKGVFTNAVLPSVLAITLACQILIVELGGRIAKTSPLSLNDWLGCIGIGATMLPIGALARCIPVTEPVVAPRLRRSNTSIIANPNATAEWAAASGLAGPQSGGGGGCGGGDAAGPRIVAEGSSDITTSSGSGGAVSQSVLTPLSFTGDCTPRGAGVGNHSMSDSHDASVLQMRPLKRGASGTTGASASEAVSPTSNASGLLGASMGKRRGQRRPFTSEGDGRGSNTTGKGAASGSSSALSDA